VDDRKIGMFDSGFGGLTVARALIDLLPGEDLVYFGDTGRYPYGPRQLDEVRDFARQITSMLVERHDVKICGPIELAAEMPTHASQLYARNVQSLVELMVGDEGALELNWEDEILAGACITRDGEIVHEGAKQAAGAPASQA